jgi:hypothetical protein
LKCSLSSVMVWLFLYMVMNVWSVLYTLWWFWHSGSCQQCCHLQRTLRETDKTVQYCGLASRSGGVLFWVTSFLGLSLQKSYFILRLIYFWYTRSKSPVIQCYMFFGKCLVSVSSNFASVVVCNCHVLLSSSIMLYEMLLLFALCGTVTPQYLYYVIFPSGKWFRKICTTGLHNFFKSLGVT